MLALFLINLPFNVLLCKDVLKLSMVIEITRTRNVYMNLTVFSSFGLEWRVVRNTFKNIIFPFSEIYLCITNNTHWYGI